MKRAREMNFQSLSAHSPSSSTLQPRQELTALRIELVAGHSLEKNDILTQAGTRVAKLISPNLAFCKHTKSFKNCSQDSTAPCTQKLQFAHIQR